MVFLRRRQRLRLVDLVHGCSSLREGHERADWYAFGYTSGGRDTACPFLLLAGYSERLLRLGPRVR